MIFSNKKLTVLFNMVGFFAKIDKIVSTLRARGKLINRWSSSITTNGTLLSKEIIAYCEHNIIYNENLLLEGLRTVYEKNN